ERIEPSPFPAEKPKEPRVQRDPENQRAGGRSQRSTIERDGRGGRRRERGQSERQQLPPPRVGEPARSDALPRSMLHEDFRPDEGNEEVVPEKPSHRVLLQMDHLEA